MMPALPASGVYLRTVMIRRVRYQACFANFMPEEGGSFVYLSATCNSARSQNISSCSSRLYDP